MKSRVFAMTTLMLGLSAAALNSVASIKTPSVSPQGQPERLPMPEKTAVIATVEADTYAEAQGKAMAELYLRRFTGQEPGQWFHDRSITLPNGVILSSNVGGVHVLYHSNDRILVSRYGRVTSLGHAINLGWLSFDVAAMAQAQAAMTAPATVPDAA